MKNFIFCAVRAASINRELEGLHHDDPIDIVRIPSQNIRNVERSNEHTTKQSSDLAALKN